MKQTKFAVLKLFVQEPYRIFFPLGVLTGTLGVGLWLFFSLGWLPQFSSFVHSSIQMQSFVLCFVVGFLMTAAPRLSGTGPASPVEISLPFLLIAGNVGLNLANEFVWAQVCYALNLLCLLRFIGSRFLKARKMSHHPLAAEGVPPVEFLWVPVGIFHGLLGSAVMISTWLKILPSFALMVGKTIVEQGFILSIVLGVAGFLAPRLMGTLPLLKTETPDYWRKEKRQKVLFNLAAGILLLASFWVEFTRLRILAYVLRSGIILAAFYRSRAFPFWPRARELYVRLLWLSIGMIELGNAGLVFLPKYRIPLLHLTFITGYSLMIFSVATMVIFSHAGMPDKLRRPSSALNLAAAGILLALFLRISADLWPVFYFRWLAASSAVWAAALLAWLALMMPYLVHSPKLAFEECHQELIQLQEEKD